MLYISHILKYSDLDRKKSELMTVFLTDRFLFVPLAGFPSTLVYYLDSNFSCSATLRTFFLVTGSLVTSKKVSVRPEAHLATIRPFHSPSTWTPTRCLVGKERIHVWNLRTADANLSEPIESGPIVLVHPTLCRLNINYEDQFSRRHIYLFNNNRRGLWSWCPRAKITLSLKFGMQNRPVRQSFFLYQRAVRP